MLKTLVIFFALAVVLHPTLTQAKAKGDTIGAPVKETMPSCTGDYAKVNPGYVVKYCDTPVKIMTGTTEKAITTATSTEKMTRAKKRAEIKKLKAEIKRLQKLIKTLSK